MIIPYGYDIPFDMFSPETGISLNNKSCEQAPEFVWEEMICYTKLRFLCEVDQPSRIMLHLSMVFSNKKRLVVDVSCNLNLYVTKESTRLDSLEELEVMVVPGIWFALDDLDSGYWHVCLNPKS